MIQRFDNLMGQSGFEKIQKKLKKELDHARYQHTLGVMYTAAALAMRYEADLEKAQLAGLLHDCAKCIPNEKKIRMCKKYNLTVTELEEDAPFFSLKLVYRGETLIAAERDGIPLEIETR